MCATSPLVRAVAHWRRYRVLYAIFAICAAPVLASYYFYYLAPPSGRTNYGDLVQPQRPLPALTLRNLDGTAVDSSTLRGSWVMVMADAGRCDESCQKKLWKMRQIRLATGKDRERVQRVFLILDREPPSTWLLREYEGTRFLFAEPAQIASFLALPAAGSTHLQDHVWLIDPLGNLMLRWPPAADPSRMKKDLEKLLRVSRIG
ncbi:MAG: SCO family protein [Sutterellaceae bacterium]|nr:SCO family protein [Burkholderiaceae bacterium]MDW8429430.1 SCO family protein [Sutterellaceae bacterium]